jgi:hypothetical protein
LAPSTPYPKVPEATHTGFLNFIPKSSISNLSIYVYFSINFKGLDRTERYQRILLRGVNEGTGTGSVRNAKAH